MKQHNIWNYFAFISIAIGFIAIGILTFWNVYPYKPMKVNSIKLITEEVRTTETLIYELDYCKFNDSKVQISRKFVDGIIFSVPEIFTKNPKGCRKTNIGIEIPHTLPAGEYKLDIFYTYQVNPIKSVTINATTDTFTVKN